MKKGKYEKQFKWSFPVKTASKAPVDTKKELKNVLLRTYFTSLISLVLCVSLFLGTSYAWFTSEVTQTQNKIHVGTLDVGLSKVLSDGTRIDMTKARDDGAHLLFDSNIAWSPGYTMVETVEIANKGTLDFKFVLGFETGALTNAKTGATVEKVTEQFTLWVRADDKKPGSITELTEENGWKPVGTLRDVLAGTPVITAELASNSSQIYTIAVHMSEGAGYELMGGSTISLTVKLVAYQKVSGAGSITPVSTAAELKAAASTAETKNMILSNDIEIKSADDRIFMNGGVLDGAKRTITYAGSKIDEEGRAVTSGGTWAGVVNTNGGVVSNLTLSVGENGRALSVSELASDLTITSCTFKGTYAFSMKGQAESEPKHVVRFTSCNLYDWVVYDNMAARVDFVGCEFYGILKPKGDTVLTNCTFVESAANDNSRGLDVSELVQGETVTLVNCVYQGKNIAKATITRTENGIVIGDTTQLVVNGDAPLK